MTKQEYILKLLTIINQDDLPIVKDIKLLVETNQISDELIDTLMGIFKSIIATSNSEIEKAKLEKGLSFLTKLQEKEKESKLQDQADMNELEGMLDDMTSNVN